MERQVHLNLPPGSTEFHSEVFKSKALESNRPKTVHGKLLHGGGFRVRATPCPDWALRIGPCACDPDPPVPMQHQEPKLSGIPRPEAASPRGRFFTPFYLVGSCSVASWKDSMRRRIQTITKGGRRQTAPALGAGEGGGAHTQDQQGGRGR